MVTLKWALTTAAFLGATMDASEAAQQQARILRVEHALESRARTETDQNIVGRNYTKFLGSEPVLARERYDVYWEPPAGGVEAGARMVFEYRREFEEDVQSITRRFALAINARHKTTFVVEPDPIHHYGRVIEWRVRLVQGGRVLAEESSANWR